MTLFDHLALGIIIFYITFWLMGCGELDPRYEKTHTHQDLTTSQMNHATTQYESDRVDMIERCGTLLTSRVESALALCPIDEINIEKCRPAAEDYYDQALNSFIIDIESNKERLTQCYIDNFMEVEILNELCRSFFRDRMYFYLDFTCNSKVYLGL